MISSPANTYYLCLPRRNTELAWNPFEPSFDASLHARTTYLSGAFRCMEGQLQATGLTFYVTPSLRALPAYGPHVVAVIQSDEPARIPSYFHKVRATFKCYGTRQELPSGSTSPYERLLSHAEFVRDASFRLPGRLNYVWQWHRQRAGLSPVYAIPLGYANQLDLPIRPFGERKTDVFFAGSIQHRDYALWSPQRWLKTPKDLSRRRMLAGVEQLRRSAPQSKIDIQLRPSFRSAFRGSAAEYSQDMMNSKICLAPRGTSTETYRFYESMRYGCVTIAERLPPHWFYDDAPAVWIENWSELPQVVESLLNDPQRMNALHTAALDWWQTRSSEEALGCFLADRLNRLFNSSAPAQAQSELLA